MAKSRHYEVVRLGDSLDGWHKRGYLPHRTGEGLVQFITVRLHDSVPVAFIQQLQRAIEYAPDAESEQVLRRKLEKLLDTGRGACYLAMPKIARIVEDALFSLDGLKYELIAWVVMPNHLHLLLILKAGFSLSAVIRELKSRSARIANAALRRSGEFWYPDYFDRYMRDERHLIKTLNYIEKNPSRAGLCLRPQDWPFASTGKRLLSEDELSLFYDDVTEAARHYRASWAGKG